MSLTGFEDGFDEAVGPTCQGGPTCLFIPPFSLFSSLRRRRMSTTRRRFASYAAVGPRCNIAGPLALRPPHMPTRSLNISGQRVAALDLAHEPFPERAPQGPRLAPLWLTSACLASSRASVPRLPPHRFGMPGAATRRPERTEASSVSRAVVWKRNMLCGAHDEARW